MGVIMVKVKESLRFPNKNLGELVENFQKEKRVSRNKGDG